MRYLVGLIGAGIAASGAPAMHEEEARALGFTVHYHLIDLHPLGLTADGLPSLLDAAALLGFSGLNITHPCKQAVIPHLDDLSPEARAIGAVNTVTFHNGVRTGHNTDWLGFRDSLRLGLPQARLDSVLLIGAGGAGNAIAYAALQLGVGLLHVFDERPDRAQALVDRYQSLAPGRLALCPDPAAVLPAADGLIHATPVGMLGHPGLAIPPALLRPDLWVADIVYFPLETELLHAARHQGCPTLDGGAMAVLQAAEGFRLFTGQQPDSQRMLARFRASYRV